MNSKPHCRNMNHGKENSPVLFCPNCGEKFKSTRPVRSCSADQHREGLKSGNIFCVDCGKKLKR